MANLINLARELADCDAVPFTGVPGAYLYNDQTPAHRFSMIVALIREGTYCVALPSRDYFDQDLATDVLAFVLNRSGSLAATKPLVILDGFACQGYSFDSVAVLSPSAANQFRHQNDLLNEHSFVVFPIFRCELSGDELPDLISLIRHDYLPSLDWKRSPCPKLLFAFYNTKTGVRSTSAQPKLATLQSVFTEIENLSGAERSWINLENYAGQRLQIQWTNHSYSVDAPNQKTARCDKEAVLDLIARFCCEKR